jgi:beta-galactosidase
MEASSKEQTINILVENMGRINFGPYLLENYKGIIGNVELGNQALQNWEIYSLPFNHPEKTIFLNKI